MATYEQISQLIEDSLPTNGTPLISAEVHRIVEKAILDFAESQWLTGDIKEIDCTNEYIASNFESNGLGKETGERAGWAICNGFNGTRNRTGRVSVAWGTETPLGTGANTFPSMGATSGATFIPTIGGETNHKLLLDELPIISISGDEIKSDGLPKYRSGYQKINIGSSQNQHNNMQPYIVTLFIQKL